MKREIVKKEAVKKKKVVVKAAPLETIKEEINEEDTPGSKSE